MAKADPFIFQELQPKLAPGETIVTTGFLFTKSLGLAALVGVLSLLGSGYFFAAATATRLFIIKTSMGLFGVKIANKGLVEIPLTDIQAITPGGFLNQKTIAFTLKDGTKLKYRLNTWAGITGGQKQFIPTLVGLHAHATKAA